MVPAAVPAARLPSGAHREGWEGWVCRVVGGEHLLPGQAPALTVAVPPLRPPCPLQRTSFSEGLPREPLLPGEPPGLPRLLAGTQTLPAANKNPLASRLSVHLSWAPGGRDRHAGPASGSSGKQGTAC